VNRVLFSSQSPHWPTPVCLYADLDKEFQFNFDPCPLENSGVDGLETDWGTRTFCNPPYGHKVGRWLAKGYVESKKGKLIVFLIPSRTDTQWWHNYCMKAKEIRFIKGRLKFGGAKFNAPFPSALVIFDGRDL
jgi:hypothetical protein